MNKPCPPHLRSAGVCRHCMAHPSGRVSSKEQGNKVSAEIGVVAVVAGVERIRESMLSIGTTGWATPCLRNYRKHWVGPFSFGLVGSHHEAVARGCDLSLWLQIWKLFQCDGLVLRSVRRGVCVVMCGASPARGWLYIYTHPCELWISHSRGVQELRRRMRVRWIEPWVTCAEPF
ncbi:Uncharacterized protein Rs2_21099 [Raphanus sativus]|nr:Uncharacterized protein Rs2_21099 [Raphanus sativus]